MLHAYPTGMSSMSTLKLSLVLNILSAHMLQESVAQKISVRRRKGMGRDVHVRATPFPLPNLLSTSNTVILPPALWQMIHERFVPYL